MTSAGKTSHGGASGGAASSGRVRWAGILATVAVVTVVGALWIARDLLFERVEVERPRAAQGDAATQSYLALEELLNRGGLPTRRVSSLEGLPPHEEVVWWLAPTCRLPPDRLLAWIEEGGHLIVPPIPALEGVMAGVGVGAFFAYDADDDDHLSPQEFQIERPDWPKFYLSSDEDDEPEVVAAEGELDAAWNMTVAYGDGLLTVVNSHDFLRNQKLAMKDHALLAWLLAHADEGRAGVRLVTHDPKPSIWLILGRRALPVAVSLVALAVFGLWAFARRVGPVRPSPSRDRRHLAEHLRASGDFLWQVGCEDALLSAQREAVADRLVRGGAQLGSRGQKLLSEAARAAERAGLDPATVARALKIREMRDREGFAGIVRVLEALRRDRDSQSVRSPK